MQLWGSMVIGCFAYDSRSCQGLTAIGFDDMLIEPIQTSKPAPGIATKLVRKGILGLQKAGHVT